MITTPPRDRDKLVSDIDERARDLVAGLTLDEKAALLTGADMWRTAAIGQVPSIMVTDGPYGLRKQPLEGDHLGIGNSTPATCFPPTVALGASFDPDLIERVGAAIGEEAKQEQVSVVLGPGVNIKRSPLCGRNFEYFSEDPILSGQLGAAWIRGVQSQGVGTSLKHYAVNNQEDGRMVVSAELDQRTLHEIYLRPFKIAVQAEQPWTVMCAYNRVNGTYASEHHELLTAVLRDEWGFEGLVVSNWGAVLDLARSVAAGLDLEMPGSKERGPGRVVEAVESGELAVSAVDAAATRVARLALLGHAQIDEGARYDADAHHDLAREAATRGAVLLKNDGGLLPLAADTSRIAVIGEFARTPRFQGAGSSQIVTTRLDNALDAIEEIADGSVTFAAGIRLDEVEDESLLAQARDVAASADVAIVFLGLPGSAESEGFDRAHIDLPANQLELLAQVTAANERVVVVLSNGAVVQMHPWIDSVGAVLEGWLLGQAGGSAIAQLLFGLANPSGKLTETIPLRLQDGPSYLNFPGENGTVLYGERIHVGYRWYDAREIDVAFPFGFGLSYTTFSVADLAVVATDGGGIAADVTVTNIGSRPGREVVQLYLELPQSRVIRPPGELKSYASVSLDPGESARISLIVDADSLAYYEASTGRWLVEGGEYTVRVGTSSRDLPLAANVAIDGDEFVPVLTLDSTVHEWLQHPVAGPLVRDQLSKISQEIGLAPDDADRDFLLAMASGSRVSSFIHMLGTYADEAVASLQEFVDPRASQS